MRKNQTGLVSLLDAYSSGAPDKPAVLGKDQSALTYGDLRSVIEFTNRALVGAGFSRGERIALVTSNGPQAATAFLSIAAGHVCAPLNPAYRAAEFEFYLSDLKPKALIIEDKLENAAADVAASLGISVIRLYSTAGAGRFLLDTGTRLANDPDFAASDDVALMLHTSGTTSRPKIVPLTHANLLENARRISASLQLMPHDRCLNVMPLFHVHGLIGAFLSSLSVGASVFCSPGFDAAEFFNWIDDCGPTWYTAVPTMHQAILPRGREHRAVIARSRLRFIRSCSSALPPQVMAELEGLFGVPVVEAYGMTEASHQMTCNPLPPAARKPGSVGLATGPDVAIMGPSGEFLPPMCSGDIVIRGASVTLGYDNNPDANAEAFRTGWFRTGDCGYLDGDGYLFIDGRTKEMINRGGEKIAPREIDEALMDHPAVRQAVAFALPDQRLGEDVGAAVVLREGMQATDSELRHFVSRKLADFKVPRKIVFVTEIPKGPTGKLQRIGLARQLKIETTPTETTREFVAPRNADEAWLSEIWGKVLGLDRVGIHDDFFALGGESVAAARLAVQVIQATGIEFSVLDVVAMPTVAQMAAWISGASRMLHKTSPSTVSRVSANPRIAVFQDCGEGRPLFCVDAHPLFRSLAQSLGNTRPFLGLLPPAKESLPIPCTVETLAAYYIESIRQVQPSGPYHLAGWCNFGVIAFEVAQQLRRSGEHVALLALFDAQNPATRSLTPALGGRPTILDRFRYHRAKIGDLNFKKLPGYLTELKMSVHYWTKRGLWRAGYRLGLYDDRRVSKFSRHLDQIVALAVENYKPKLYEDPMVLVRARDGVRHHAEDPTRGWISIAPSLVYIESPGNHRTMFHAHNVEAMAHTLCEMMDGDMPGTIDCFSSEPPAVVSHVGC